MAHPSIASRLAAIEEAGEQRRLRPTEGLGGCRVRVEGRDAVSFGSCDYLGLAGHERTARAAADAALEHGSGSGAARLLTGHSALGESLEAELAEHFGAPSALVYGAGYLANLGVITALAGPGDMIFSDRLNHRSTIDACRLSGAEVVVFDHNDAVDLERRLERARAGEASRGEPGRSGRGKSGPGVALIVVEGVYSMDGEDAPLAAIAEVARRTGALLVIDDAHGLGVRGPGGRGSAAAAGVTEGVAVQIGNLGKALGSYGAFVLADADLRELLVQRSGTFVFTCALPPSVLAAARAGLAVLREEPQRLRRLHDNVASLRAALTAAGIETLGRGRDDVPIVPVPVADGERALQLSRDLLERGYLVPAIRPPTVPAGSCRLRITVTAEHGPAEVAGLAAALDELLHE